MFFMKKNKNISLSVFFKLTNYKTENLFIFMGSQSFVFQ